MSTATRIDELRKKFEENPRRYFAPLANEYRKAGDLAQAIALCREHLPKQPGHMSGYIVFGQALYEAGELGEALKVFEQALDLDPENLIALRHLGDIARANGDASGARRWYERVLDADPRNDDIAAQLATLATGGTPASVPSVVPSFEALSRSPETPAVPMTSIGFGIMPTPDSVMRAVDMDAVNARMPDRTPLDLDAIESAADETVSVDAGAAEAAGGETPRAETALADMVTAETDAAETVSGASSTTEGNSEVAVEVDVPESLLPSQASPQVLPQAEADAFDFPDDMESPESAGRGAIADAWGEVVMDVDEESFEEGLIAVEWPDTSELVSRVLTPRAFTPRHVTPLDSTSIDDAVSAFGRDPGDPLPAPPEHAGDTELIAFESELQVGPIDAPDTMVEVSAESLAEALEEASALAFAESPSESAFEAIPASISVDEISAVAPLIPEAEDIADTADAEELPWLTMSDTLPESLADLESTEPGLEAIAEAFAEDARGAGDDGAMSVEAMQESLPIGETESFADVARELVAEATTPENAGSTGHEAPYDVEPVVMREADTPAFVTETMGELLVSQGFLARAVDVYEELVRRRPYDPVLSSRLGELRAMMLPVEDAAETIGAGASTTEDESYYSSELEASFAPPSMEAELAAPTPTPGYGTPAYGTPFTMPRVTPYAQPTLAGEFLPRRSARDWFAAIAARRVPRRTPPQSAPAVESSPEGLAALFGNDPSVQDDAAAQALADAFAPVSAHELESGTALDFEFARSTPAFSAAVDAGEHASRAPSPTPAADPSTAGQRVAGPSSPTGTGNAGFSFDKFFPDPAMRRATPLSSSPVALDAPVTDDLAQFSAWLKGLGNS